jgi:chromosome segregation ATPase
MPATEIQLAQLESKLNATANDVTDIKGVITSIDRSLQKLTVLEERHTQTRDDLDEIKDSHKDHERRIQALEIHDAKGLWVERVVWVAVAGIIATVIKMGL